MDKMNKMYLKFLKRGITLIGLAKAQNLGSNFIAAIS